ncbi:glycosyl hydrolase, family 1 [Ancylostoma duodenale]|uniref:Glycosyl hydrolase, family 1 n=1 Tax=Ancylostoma duodenale TaxID=51022 RepID=A0A0C2BZF9_9BILA|nr:glycosyl hydrolase, family 1 [Ancylostoma duodenale]
MKSLGVTHYRFSISWSRIFPAGVGKPNPKGVQYYHDVIDTLVKNGIKPMITLYHWDLPLALHDKGGWLNHDIVKWFRLYAVFCFKEYGDKLCFYWCQRRSSDDLSTSSILRKTKTDLRSRTSSFGTETDVVLFG